MIVIGSDLVKRQHFLVDGLSVVELVSGELLSNRGGSAIDGIADTITARYGHIPSFVAFALVSVFGCLVCASIFVLILAARHVVAGTTIRVYYVITVFDGYLVFQCLAGFADICVHRSIVVRVIVIDIAISVNVIVAVISVDVMVCLLLAGGDVGQVGSE